MAFKRKKSKRPAMTPERKRAIAVVLACVVIGLLLAVPIPFCNTVIGYFPLFAYLFTLLLSYVYLRVLKRDLVFSEEGIGDGCLRGEKIPFKLVVENKSYLPAVSVKALFFISDLFGDERESVYRRISLPPRSSKTFDFAVSFDHIGTYQVGIKQIEVTDPFGIFKHVVGNRKLRSVRVQPRIFELDPIELSTESAQESKRTVITVIDDGMDYCGVREYRWGDPIKSIHWKLSARTADGEYFTRLYETSRNPGIEVFVDFDSLNYDAEQLMYVYDAVVESALSIEAWGSAQGYETTFLFEDIDGTTMRCAGPLAGQHAELVSLMPRIAPGDGSGMLDILESESNYIYAQNNLIVCTACLTDRLIGSLISVQANRKNPVLFAVVPPGIERNELDNWGTMLARLSAASISYVVLDSAEQLRGRA